MARSTTGHLAAVAALAGCVFLAGPVQLQAQEKKEKPTIGRLEKVWIGDARVILPAKIDTGARTSSLGVDRIETFERRGQDWVRFSFPGPAGKPVTLERELVHHKPVKGRNGAKNDIRPVILLKLCVADIYRVTQVNLANRARLNYPFLIGRRFLFGKATVDIARKYTSDPRCSEMNGG